LRSALRALLETNPDLTVVGEAATVEGLVEVVRATEPDVLVVDCGLHRRCVVDGLPELLKGRPNLSVVVLGVCSDEPCIQRLFRVGVRGYVLKTSSESELIGAIRSVFRGDRYLDSTLVPHVSLPRPEEAGSRPLSGLTDRELEVCRLLAYGHTNAEVAGKLAVSGRTVEAHRARIMAKLQLRTRADLVQFALQHGLMRVR